MRTLIIALLLLPLAAFTQTSDFFLKLTNAKGQQITGTSEDRRYSKSIIALTNSSGGKNDVLFNFTMVINGASAELKRVMANGEFLTSGEFYIIPASETRTPSFIKKFEKIRVLSCVESMGCNGTMTTAVTLQAARVGSIYYSQNKVGAWIIDRKFGWDAEGGKEWTNF